MKKRLVRKKPQWDEILRESHLIAAVRDKDGLQRALISPLKIVYLLFGNPMNIAGMLSSVRAEGKLPLVNADLLQGFSRDAYAVEFLANSGTAGIISTHHETLRAAHSMEWTQRDHRVQQCLSLEAAFLRLQAFCSYLL